MDKARFLFEKFCQISSDPDAVAYALKHIEPVESSLGKDEDFGQYFVDSFLYGSYKRQCRN